MKTIIISDIHNRVYWIEDALSSPILQPYDEIIFLGDYFDDFNDTPEDATDAARWLKQSLHRPNRIHLIGTHDIWYMFPYNRFIAASGNTEAKAYAIRGILTKEDWNKLYLYYYEQNFLLSHAGLHTNLISQYIFEHKDLFDKYITNKEQLNGQEIVDQIVKPATIEAINRVKDGYAHPWLDAGVVRGGRQPVGGITWLDWIYEFKPIPGLNQIVGHTELNVPGEKYVKQQNAVIKSSINYDLDTRSNHVGILENSKFSYIETIEVLEAI
jgi:predicted phosphodiesterase